MIYTIFYDRTNITKKSGYATEIFAAGATKEIAIDAILFEIQKKRDGEGPDGFTLDVKNFWWEQDTPAQKAVRVEYADGEVWEYRYYIRQIELFDNDIFAKYISGDIKVKSCRKP